MKEEYANITSAASQQHFHPTTTEQVPEDYYERLLESVISEIENGTLDNCRSGSEVVNRVAVDKSVLSHWKSL